MVSGLTGQGQEGGLRVCVVLLVGLGCLDYFWKSWWFGQLGVFGMSG